jgi:hypothetical protein
VVGGNGGTGGDGGEGGSGSNVTGWGWGGKGGNGGAATITNSTSAAIATGGYGGNAGDGGDAGDTGDGGYGGNGGNGGNGGAASTTGLGAVTGGKGGGAGDAGDASYEYERGYTAAGGNGGNGGTGGTATITNITSTSAARGGNGGNGGNGGAGDKNDYYARNYDDVVGVGGVGGDGGSASTTGLGIVVGGTGGDGGAGGNLGRGRNGTGGTGGTATITNSASTATATGGNGGAGVTTPGDGGKASTTGSGTALAGYRSPMGLDYLYNHLRDVTDHDPDGIVVEKVIGDDGVTRLMVYLGGTTTSWFSGNQPILTNILGATGTVKPWQVAVIDEALGFADDIHSIDASGAAMWDFASGVSTPVGIAETVNPWLSERRSANVDSDTLVVLVGYSQGGMDAQNIAAAATDLGYNVTTLVTYGSPIVQSRGDDGVAYYVDTVHIADTDDPIPGLPVLVVTTGDASSTFSGSGGVPSDSSELNWYGFNVHTNRATYTSLGAQFELAAANSVWAGVLDDLDFNYRIAQ